MARIQSDFGVGFISLICLLQVSYSFQWALGIQVA